MQTNYKFDEKKGFVESEACDISIIGVTTGDCVVVSVLYAIEKPCENIIKFYEYIIFTMSNNFIKDPVKPCFTVPFKDLQKFVKIVDSLNSIYNRDILNRIFINGVY